MIIRVFIFLTSLLVGCWSATMMLVDKIGPMAIADEGFALGSKIFYPPWLWVKWFLLYGDKFQTIFVKTMWPIYASVALGIAFSWAYRFIFAKKAHSTAHGSSRLAKESELARVGLTNDQGVVLGRSLKSGALLCHNGPEHVLLIAPTRGGKGVGLVIPTLLTWEDSAVIFDPKGENWQVTSGYRARFGRSLYFNPTSSQTTCFNPLAEIRRGAYEVKDAQNIADIIVDPDGRLDSRNHWQNAAHSLLVGVILHVLHEYPRKSLAGVVEFLTRPGSDFEQTLNEMTKSAHVVVNSTAQEMLNKHVEERSGVLSTAVSLLTIFRDPLVAHATDSHDINIILLRTSETPISLYLVLPPSDISRLRVLLRIMLNQIGRILTENLAEHDANNRRVLFLLDEFPALGRLEFFESALAYMGGYGLKAFLICQSLNQLQKAYGERNSILDNCHVRVAFASNDDQTARRLSDLLGEQTLVKEQTSVSGARFAMVKPASSISKIEYARALLLPSEIMRLPADQEIILINGMFPILAKKIRYYECKTLKARVCPPFSLERLRKECVQKTEVLLEEASVNVRPQHIGSSL
jgi:type IV secretion system protein VirD4